ncbi:ATPase [Exophiala aquamarina CBS 119918]|uniref:ATPase n=1 Tax=Exophiala aquamarina CBS 119918 TaxID=1182545 RepID=A0A072PKC8_9EURO|nr:ATPase [Exophiala aquamarina CBS 119918]KEF60306.1 ATPase [Exophiala aquamarina CBS 119918]
MYGSLSHEEARPHRGYIVMDEDENTFFPTLTARETIEFTTRLNVAHNALTSPSSSEEARRITIDFLFRMLNIFYAKNTKVGNEYIRGVSGGERKRIGIAEVMAT